MPASSTKTPERDGNTPPVAVDLPRQITGRQKIVIAVAAVIAAIGWTMVAFVRGEHVNSIWFVMAAVGSYVIGYMLYSRLVQYKVIRPRDDLATPAEQFENGQDFMPTDRRVLFGHHFAAIAGAGPLVGPVLAAQMGYLPGTLWIIFGVIFAGAVQDYMVLAISTRRGGRSLGQMARDTLGPVGGWAAMLAVMTIMVILIAVLGLVVMTFAVAQNFFAIAAATMILVVGVRCTMSSAALALMGDLPEDQTSLGAALNDTVQELGNSVGVAIIGTVMAIIVGINLPGGQWPQALVDNFIHAEQVSFAIMAVVVAGFVALGARSLTDSKATDEH